MLKPRALRPGDRLAVVAPASAFDATSSTRASRRSGASASSRSTTRSVFARARLRGRIGRRSGPRRSARPGGIRRSRASSACAAATAARRCCRCSTRPRRSQARQAVHRLQRPHRPPDVSDACTAGLVAFHGPMLAGRLGRGQRGLRSRLRSSGRCADAEPMGELAPPGLESVRSGEARGPLLGGTLTQLLASLGTPFAFNPPDGLRPVPRRSGRAAVPARSHGHAAAADRPAGRAGGDRDRRAAALRRAGRRTTRPRGHGATFSPTFPDPLLFGFPSGHTTVPR